MSDPADDPPVRHPKRAPGPESASVFRPADPPANPARQGAPRSPKPKGSGRDREPIEQTGGPGWLERIFFGRVSVGHRAVFCRQAATYLEAGVDLTKTFTSLQKQFSRTALGPVMGRIQQSIRQGDSLAAAFAREPDAFDPMFLSMIRVAEARGAIPEVLRRMADQYEARQRLMRQARSAMIYPVAVVLILFVVMWLLTSFVLPGLVSIIADMSRGGRAQIPAVTRALMAVSGFMKWVGWWAMPLGAIGGFWLGRRWYRTAAGKATLDAIVLRIPVLGQLVSKLDTARFARNLGALLDAGVDIGSGLDLTREVVQNASYKRAVATLRPAVVDGEELSHAMAATGRFGPDALATVENGESTGKLPETLDKLADQYEEQVEYIVKNLGQLVQPLIVLVLGGFVLFILLAFFMAYIQLITGLSSGL